MTTSAETNNPRGFTLVELMVVLAIFGLVSTAMYSVYLSHMKTAFSQEEVLDVQQNLRIALDAISDDIMRAGTLVPTGTTPIAAPGGTPVFPSYSSSIRITTGSTDGCMARVSVAPAAATQIVTVDPPAKTGDPSPVDAFNVNDLIRIVSPIDGTSLPDSFRVQSIDKTSNPLLPTITLDPAVPDNVAVGDMLVRTADSSALPHSIDYYLVNGGTTVPPATGYTCPANQKCLVRRVNGSTAVVRQEIVATNISSLRFAYVSDNEVVTPPTGEAVPSDLNKIRAVRITLQGGTTKTRILSGTSRNRAITSIIKLRNRR